jgi:hypothetical protein
LSEETRSLAHRVAGIAIVLLGIGAAFLPAGKTIPSAMIGGLLIAAGLIETIAGVLRLEVRPYAMAAGIVTALAGLLFVLNPETHFFPTVWPIVGWLLLRSIVLAAAAVETRGSVRTWRAFGGHGFPARHIADCRLVDLDDRDQRLWSDARAGCSVRVDPGGELRGQRADASGNRELRNRGGRLASMPAPVH